jgi:hypothetical protein
MRPVASEPSLLLFGRHIINDFAKVLSKAYTGSDSTM